ncbi:uncharacterized protein ISCGN_010997 [Ixodes scapularis]
MKEHQRDVKYSTNATRLKTELVDHAWTTGHAFDFTAATTLAKEDRQITATLGSSCGYTAKNILNFIPPIPDIGTLEAYVAYVACNECVVLRTTYISNSTCALLKPQSQLNQNTTCCDFIFDLLCGTTPKYYNYDESC